MGNSLILLIFAVVACVLGLSALVILWFISERLNRLTSDFEDVKQYLAYSRDLLDTMAKATDLALGRIEDRVEELEKKK